MKKCIVLDLDNTLWGGIVGEDGIDGIKLGLASPGSDFVAFQQALLDLYNQGIILALNSRNNHDDALAAIRNHPNMILKENHFAASRINWNDKALNIRELAEELNIGLDSMVFFDDDPVNRLLVRSTVPEVEVPDLPAEPSRYVQFLNSLPFFTLAAATDEDKMRGTFYVTERLRKEHEKQFPTKVDFLRSLNMAVTVYFDDESSAPRLAQLTEKTNQFNTNKRAMSEEEIKGLVSNRDYAVFCARAEDRFGSHGIIAFAVVKKEKHEWTIETLLGSCRILGRGIEDAFLESMRAIAEEGGAERLRVVFVPTEKNQPAKDFIEKYFHDNTLLVNRKNLAPKWVRLNYHTK